MQERYGFVWMAVDEPVAPFPVFPEWGTPGFDCAINEPRHTPVSVGHLVDNFLDATHLSTVHASTFGVTDDPVVPSFEVRATAGSRRASAPSPTATTTTRWWPPASTRWSNRRCCSSRCWVPRRRWCASGFPLTGKTITFLFASCPETADRTRLFKLMARDDYAGDPTLMADALEFEDRVLDEDLVVLEAYDERRLALDLRTEVHTRADRLSVMYRRLLAELVHGATTNPTLEDV